MARIYGLGPRGALRPRHNPRGGVITNAYVCVRNIVKILLSLLLLLLLLLLFLYQDSFYISLICRRILNSKSLPIDTGHTNC